MSSTYTPKEDPVLIIVEDSDSESDKETRNQMKTTGKIKENKLGTDFLLFTEKSRIENSSSLNFNTNKSSKNSISHLKSDFNTGKTGIKCLPSTSGSSCSSRTNRRKMCHDTVKAVEDISFISYVQKDNATLKEKEESHSKRYKKSIPKKGKPDKSIKEAWDKVIAEEGESNNPNADLLKKTAFLRGCINYILLNMGMEEFEFTGNDTLEGLIEKYNTEKARNEKKENDIRENKEE